MEKKIEDENLIAYCGLYCGDCHGYTGKVPDLARDLRKELRQIHYDKFAAFISTYSFGKDFKNYDFRKVSRTMKKYYKTISKRVRKYKDKVPRGFAKDLIK